MNKVISWVKNIHLRQILTVFLMGITIFVIQAFGYSNALQAQAEPVTPEATSYQVERNDKDNIKNDNKLVEKSRRNLKETADNVREKLSLDEPLDSGKEVLKSAQEKVKDVVEPRTGKNRGYYQDNKPAR
jgi:hypothetical protein